MSTSNKVIIDQRAEATKYLKEKKVDKLFDILGAQLARVKPSDPNEFLLGELRRIEEAKRSNCPVCGEVRSSLNFVYLLSSITYVSWLNYNTL